ncbi:MAG: protein kinase, partial [Polyangiaceae bacterium]
SIAHEAGVIHRDLKPSNVFLEQRRSGLRVKILDFGISKLPKKISTQSLTQVGQSLGTFSFMPPEQIGKAKSVDHRADIYAATTLIYQAMSGKLPYHAKNVVAMMELKNKTEPRTLGEVMKSPVSPQLEAFIAKGLARDPDTRFQTAMEALDGWRQLRPEGATSVMDVDGSGSYNDFIDDSPSSSELKTKVLRKPNLPALDPIPATLPANALSSGNDSSMPSGPLSTTQPMQRVVEEANEAPAPNRTLVSAASSAGTNPAATGISSPPGALLRPTQKTSSVKTTITLILGAIALMAVGFVAVALVLHFLG